MNPLTMIKYFSKSNINFVFSYFKNLRISKLINKDFTDKMLANLVVNLVPIYKRLYQFILIQKDQGFR